MREDLFDRYNLYGIAATVARNNPDGSKGVKLRKTYKNHIMDHGLVGPYWGSVWSGVLPRGPSDT